MPLLLRSVTPLWLVLRSVTPLCLAKCGCELRCQKQLVLYAVAALCLQFCSLGHQQHWLRILVGCWLLQLPIGQLLLKIASLVPAELVAACSHVA
jgi:hypothetical protein